MILAKASLVIDYQKDFGESCAQPKEHKGNDRVSNECNF